MSYPEKLALAFRVTESAVRQALGALGPAPGSRGLDAGCGTGQHTVLLAEQIGPTGAVVGLDICAENLEVAREASRVRCLESRVDFVEGDIRALPFDDESFDWVWCSDTLYPAVVAPDPATVVAEFSRVLRPSGALALVYWTSQCLLPGYSALEARLNVAFASSVPYEDHVEPSLRYQRSLGWLRDAGLRDLLARSFVADVQSPLSAEMRQAVDFCMSMLWEEWGDAVSADDLAALRALRDHGSSESILSADDYYGFVVYTLFSATKPARDDTGGRS